MVSYIDTMSLNSKQRKTLRAVFDTPIRSDVPWADIEKLLAALGAEITEGSGSRVRVVLSGARAVFHRPHPQRETDKGALRSIQRFISEAGHGPDDGS